MSSPNLSILKALQSGNISVVEAKQQIKNSSAAITSHKKEENDKIAIVGMSGKYPDAMNLSQYWKNLAAGKNSIKEIPVSRWDIDHYYDPRPYQKGKTYCKWLGILDDIECFDPSFFSIPPAEAELMDPQHRLFLQEAYRAFEDAGYNKKNLSNKKCGVYLGIMSFEYGLMLHGSKTGIAGTMGNSYSIAAARIAYHLNLKGPAIALDTACSSSLVTTHLACQALLNKETDMALAGGVSLYLTPESYMSMSSAGMLSKEGQCKTLDDDADGFVPGEGVGAVVLKRLSDAIRDKDNIHGVIIGSGINQDGRTNGMTAPSVKSQIELEQEIYSRYAIDPESIQYVEMHGTGTKLGDPIELEALSDVYTTNSQKKNYCGLGSVKSNIGHTSAAAGVASIHKVLLSMKHQKIAPTLNIQRPTSKFDFKESPFYINRTLKEWEQHNLQPRRAAISSFGFSGTNAHMVIEEYEDHNKNINSSFDSELILLSAKNQEQLNSCAHNLIKYLQKRKDINLKDLAYTLQVGRDEMEFRLAFKADAIDEVIEILTFYLKNKTTDDVETGIVDSDDEIEITEDNYKVSALRGEKLKKIAKLWVEGKTVHWSRLYTNTPQRISLPTYPFAKEQYWLPNEGKYPVINSDEMKENKQPKFLKKNWIPIEQGKKENYKGQIILLCSKETEGLAHEIASYFNNAEIIHHNQVDILDYTQYQWKNYSGWIDIVGCGKKKEYSSVWIPLLQQLVEYGNRDKIKLLGVSQGLEAFGQETINPAGADRVALYRTLQNEYSHLETLHLDLPLNEDNKLLAKEITNEFFTENKCSEICIRESVRYKPVLKEQYLDTSVNDKVFSADDVLWITGGTRGIGLQCAHHFVKHYGIKKLVLTGRENIPPRKEWANHLKENTSIADKLRSIQELEAVGAQVLVDSILLTDKKMVQEYLTDIKKKYGKITGFIHSAGMVDMENPAFIRKSQQKIEEVKNIKTIAVDVLYECLKNEQLKYFIMFSSVAATVPSLGVGQSDYAMANAYMDYFSESCSEDFPVISIQWASWKETGFGEVKSKNYKQTGFLSQTNKEGLLMLDTLLYNNCSGAILPVIVNSNEWYPERLLDNSYQESFRGTQEIEFENSLEANAFSEEWMDNVQKLFTDILAQELKMNRVNLKPDKPFQQFGIDSIILAQLVVKIEKAMGVKLDPTVLLEYVTIHSFSNYLVNTYPNELRTKFSTPAPKLSPSKIAPSQIHEKIAIVGMACHFPGATNIKEFWDNLKEGKDSISRVPLTRWDETMYYDPEGYVPGKSISNRGGFLDAIEEFDPAYFGISETLAPYIDPLQRQWLEVSTEAMIDAGLDIEKLSGKNVGVFTGARTSNFGVKYPGKVKDRIVGIGQNFIAAHLSHIYNFKGPNMVIDTACSSALTAVHQAIASIRNGESEIALAGGVDILLDEGLFVGLSDAKILSPDGQCKTFDANANGIAIGEGCGVLILKPLKQAIQDNQKIYAVIDSSVINNDGNTMGITTPNPEAQSDLITAAIEKGQIDPETISYVETHGTGTLIGDPIELKGLTKVLDRYTHKKQFCGVGSVKSNIGHLLSAAGAASIIKVALSITNKHLSPTLHCDNPNPRFNFKKSPLYPVLDYQEWKSVNGVLRAGISSFGLGGNNAHIIISNEGIPDSHQAFMEPKGESIVFNKKVYWPSSLIKEPVPLEQPESVENDQEEEFMNFFNIDEA